MKSIKVLAAAGALALAPSVASAFTGNLVQCNPTIGQDVLVKLKPGLQCASVKNKIQIKKAVSDNCVVGAGTLAAPTDLSFCVEAGKPVDCCTGAGTGPSCTLWDLWAAKPNKIGSKIQGAAAATIDSVSVDVKAEVFGSCDFGGNPDSIGAGGKGKFTFFDAVGDKIKGGKGQFFGGVGGDIATQSAKTTGLVTKGFGVGGHVIVQVGINLAGASDCSPAEDSPGSCNGYVLACNTPMGACPPDLPAPASLLDLITDANSVFRIDIEDNADCVGSGDPFQCCTGAGTGNC